jgi:hypothetical protein
MLALFPTQYPHAHQNHMSSYAIACPDVTPTIIGKRLTVALPTPNRTPLARAPDQLRSQLAEVTGQLEGYEADVAAASHKALDATAAAEVRSHMRACARPSQRRASPAPCEYVNGRRKAALGDESGCSCNS